MAILVKRKSKFGNSFVETQYCGDFGPEKAKILKFCPEKRHLMAFGLAKGIILKLGGISLR